MIPQSADSPVLFFDGVCNLCNHAIQFIIRHDRVGKVKFAPLQSHAGEAATQAVQQQLGYVPDSLILRVGGKYYTESAAALKVAGYLDGGWQLLKVLMIIPGFLRNPVYRFVAANRYRWLGRKQECMIPTPALKSRFL
jgi:predicted DCC family thiol-disulfide oxidoreductase YuxK